MPNLQRVRETLALIEKYEPDGMFEMRSWARFMNAQRYDLIRSDAEFAGALLSLDVLEGTAESTVPLCNTSACAAGWAEVSAGYILKADGNAYDHTGRLMGDTGNYGATAHTSFGARLLDISYDAASQLFTATPETVKAVFRAMLDGEDWIGVLSQGADLSPGWTDALRDLQREYEQVGSA